MTSSPAPTPSYTVAAGRAEAELREKGSRFLALLIPAVGEVEARDELDAVRKLYPDATHHCWAWRLGAEGSERSNDDGEPSGTAGSPMLRVLRGAGVTELLAVVVRWYGGTKLGKGGLARAYAGAVREALLNLPTERRLVRRRVLVTLPYPTLGAIKRLIHPPDLEVLADEYGGEVRLTLAGTEEKLADLRGLAAGLGFHVTPLDD